MNKAAVLVLFSGGQDSTTVLAWALSQYQRVETVGFIYGQKHIIEMEQRPTIRELVASSSNEWAERLGPDHIIDLSLIDQIAKNITPLDTPSRSFPFGRRYIPGRNLIMLSMAASIAFRRDIGVLSCGASETEYSGYPDCRRESMNAIAHAITECSGTPFEIVCPLMDLDKAGVWQLAQSLGGDSLIKIVRSNTHTCYEGNREVLHEWGYGCSECDACRLRAKGWLEFKRG
jgi:7-cyano-7-deazaguanine synthase